MDNSNYSLLAGKILGSIGGDKNVKAIRHCVSRIRFLLIDESLASTEVLKEVDGIKDAIYSGGEYQVIIGEKVSEVYNSLIDISNIKSGPSPWQF